jgi:hypothetical protein
MTVRISLYADYGPLHDRRATYLSHWKKPQNPKSNQGRTAHSTVAGLLLPGVGLGLGKAQGSKVKFSNPGGKHLDPIEGL